MVDDADMVLRGRAFCVCANLCAVRDRCPLIVGK